MGEDSPSLPIRKDGSTFPVLTFSAPILRDGKTVGVRGFAVDITERKRSEQAVRESEERYRLLADDASDVIWCRGLDLTLTYVSPSVERLRGFTVEEVLA